jgi:hypothetical protein
MIFKPRSAAFFAGRCPCGRKEPKRTGFPEVKKKAECGAGCYFYFRQIIFMSSCFHSYDRRVGLLVSRRLNGCSFCEKDRRFGRKFYTFTLSFQTFSLKRRDL